MADTNYIQVNHKVLVWARESLALTRNQAAENSGVTVKRLTQLEEGEKQITLDELREFSKAYKRTNITRICAY